MHAYKVLGVQRHVIYVCPCIAVISFWALFFKVPKKYRIFTPFFGYFRGSQVSIFYQYFCPGIDFWPFLAPIAFWVSRSPGAYTLSEGVLWVCRQHWFTYSSGISNAIIILPTSSTSPGQHCPLWTLFWNYVTATVIMKQRCVIHDVYLH